jgi:hypothetical protein
VEVQLVTPALGGFEGVRVRAALCQPDEADGAQGFAEAVPAVEVPIKDQDFWAALDTTGKASHKDAGVGGLALVRPEEMRRRLLCMHRTCMALSTCARHVKQLQHIAPRSCMHARTHMD